jgi:hypothetical protein
MKFRSLIASLVVPVISVYTSPASAGYLVDQKIGEGKLSSSSEATELGMLKALTGVSDFVIDFYSEQNTALENPDAPGQWYFNTGVYTPGFFVLKFCTCGTQATADTYFFKNVGEMSRLVWSNDQVQYLSGGAPGPRASDGNIGRLIHYRFAGVAQEQTNVPEPASLGLAALALLGMGAARRRKP